MQEPNKTDHLPLTGERYIPGMEGNMQLEHLHRYAVAAEYVKGKVVLDIACGEGYGSVMLSGAARKVFGVDISPEVILYAQNKYRNDKLEFKVGTCAAIPLKDSSVDAVISFETIEHHDQHDTMMAEIKRVLKPQGILIISSPDKHNYSDVPVYKNPFHVKELYYDEFKSLLESCFCNVTIYGQRIMYGSGIFAQDCNDRMVTYDLKEMCNSDLQKARFEGIAKPRYLIAVASDVALPEAVGGILEQPVWEGEIFRQAIAPKEEAISQKDNVIAEKVRALEKANTDITNLQAAVAEKDRAIADANTVITENESAITALEEAIAQKETVIAEKNQALEKADTNLANLQVAVAEKDRALADANAAIAENESIITALEETITQKDAVISKKERELADKEEAVEQAIGDIKQLRAAIEKKGRELAEADAVIAEKEQVIAAKVEAISQKETLISEKDQILEKANTDIANLQAMTEERDLAITDKDQQIHGYREELYSVYTSRSWRFTLPMRKVGTLLRRILTIPHRPWLRTKIKRAYFLLPLFIRHSRLIDNLKNRFKEKEIL